MIHLLLNLIKLFHVQSDSVSVWSVWFWLEASVQWGQVYLHCQKLELFVIFWGILVFEITFCSRWVSAYVNVNLINFLYRNYLCD